jgi:arylsulfatase
MIAGPGITRHGHIDASTMAVYDVAPTLYEFAGIDPNKSLAKKPVLPMIGVSFKRYLTGEVQAPPRGTALSCTIRRRGSMVNGSCGGWCRGASPPVTRRGSCLICTTTRWRPMTSRPNIPIGSKR